MPQWLEDCKDKLLAQKDFYPKRKDRESIAYAICTEQHKNPKKADTEDDMTTENCICPECGHQTPHKQGTPCMEMKCPECNEPMVRKERKSIPMRITKATLRNGRMYWQGAISDTDWDDEDERMAVSLFQDFKSHLDEDEPPFVSLSHYRRMDDKSGEMGTVQDIWAETAYDKIDFYADGYFHDTSLAKACFEAAQSELQRIKSGEKVDEPVRFSIGFFPKETEKDDQGRVTYLSGTLDHVALTRVPINPRTRFTQVTEKSMAKTRKEDALSIVGADDEEIVAEVERLDEKQRQKADVLDELVIKSEDEDSPYTEEQDIILRANLQELGLDDGEIEEKAWSYAQKKALPDSAYAWVEKGEGCEKKDGKTPQKCRHLPYKSSGGAVDCPHVRAALQAVGGARTGKKMSVPSGVVQKLRSALKSCQKSKSALEAELSEYEQGRIDGYNAALDLDIPEEEVSIMEEQKKSDLNLDEVIKTLKPEEVAELPKEEPDPIAVHANLLKQIPSAEGTRAQKLEATEGILRALAAHCVAEIDKLTPVSTEDIAKSLVSELDAKLKPVLDKMAVLEAAVTKAQSVSPQSRAIKSEGFYISPEETILKAQGLEKSESSIRKLARQGLGLPEDRL